MSLSKNIENFKMISQFAHEYVHYDSVGNFTRCEEVIQKTKDILEKIYSEQKIEGYQLFLIQTSTDAENELIEADYNMVTKGYFPFVYSFVQPANESRIDFDNLMEELHYTRVDV